ncbi:Hypothetical protein POVR2_LOCUS182 [uncultured virus]|nr:Hypothetical protein POVR2_LOCUS182 [uncultured virus]
MLLQSAAEHLDIQTMKFLVDGGYVRMIEREWMSELVKVVRLDAVESVRYILTQVELSGSKLLKAIDNDMVFGPGLLTLLRDQRIAIETLSVSAVRRLYRYREDSDVVRGYTIGSAMAGGRFSSSIELGREIETDMLLRYIVLVRPTAVELLDWMASLNDSNIATAASLVLEDTVSNDQQLETIRALLVIVRYSQLSLQELIRTDSLNAEAARLVGAYLGETGLRARIPT